MNFRKFLSAQIFFLSINLSYANDTLNPIIVGSSITPTDIHSSPSSIEVFTASDIQERGYDDISELLGSISSINISTTGGIGQSTSVFMRGTESNHTKIIFNGVELNPGTLGLAPIQNISISSIDKIEIIKGSSSALHGANTIGGIINITSKKDENSIIMSTGSWTTNKTSIVNSFNKNGLRMYINANRNESKSIPTKITSSKRHSYNTNNLALGIRKELNNYVFISNFYTSLGNTQYDNFGSNINQDHDDYFYTFGLKKFINNDVFEANYKKSQNRIMQAAPSATDFTDTLRDIYDMSYTKVSNEIIQKIGLVYTKEHMSELSYGTRHTAFPIIKELFYQSELSDPDYLVNYGIRHIDHSQFGHFTTGNLGVSFLNSDDVYSFNIARSLRAPDSTDLYGYGGIPTLVPEESLSLEFGIKRYINKDTFLRGTLFKTTIKNLIEADFNSVLYTAESKITGLELRYQSISSPIKYDIGYTYMVPRDIKNNQPLSKRSKHKLNANFTYAFNQNNTINLNIAGEGKRKATPYYDIDLGSYYIVNLNYIYEINDSSINLGVKNLFDRPYRNSHNFNTLDRSAFVTYSYKY
tara:strand:- start:1729 stop:3483 length:1755 start_codon:yes stop_codon:yes gene_type:complete